MSLSRASLTQDSKHFPGCCAGLSTPLLGMLVENLPKHPALVLSIGCGSGLLESLILDTAGDSVNLCGVEVASCANTYLPDDRFWHVRDTRSIHSDALLATSLMFVYARQPQLVQAYIDECSNGALETLLWLGPRCDWPEYEQVLTRTSTKLHVIEVGAAASDLLVLASFT